MMLRKGHLPLLMKSNIVLFYFLVSCLDEYGQFFTYGKIKKLTASEFNDLGTTSPPL